MILKNGSLYPIPHSELVKRYLNFEAVNEKNVVLFPIAKSILEGINIAISNIQFLQSINFKELFKVQFPEEQSSNFENGEDQFSVTQYQAVLFNAVRVSCNIPIFDFIYSFSRENNLFGSKSPGKSGSSMFYSYDMKYVVKEVYEEELQFFVPKVADYCSYILSNPNSLIVRIFGLFTINFINSSKKFHFVVMENLLPFELIPNIDCYDLKGKKMIIYLIFYSFLF